MDEQFGRVELTNSPAVNSDSNEASAGSSSSIKKPSSSSRTFMKWTEAKDIILCKEVTLQNPFQFRRGSLERGKVWSGVATELRKQSFKVDQRAVRDRYNSLKNKVQKNNSQDKRASGISPEETESQRELRVLLEDLANQEDDAELLPKTNASEEEQRRLDGQEVQKRACESFVETRKRHFADKENMPRKRNSGSDALQFLHQKMELEREMRKEELAMRRAEVKRDEAERDRRFELFQQQQQQTQQQFMQQQQQMQQHLAQQQQQMQNMLMMFMQSMKGNNKQ
ncbi:uncharacterized protein [Apostichopus japonicus]|uniref:uncharacterized protein n=1 Tax=Stichopus japonicus TaxID=307972 RepID=UPI003AB586AC